MALGNWDALALDHDGYAIRGEFIFSRSKIGLVLRKNWLDIYDESAAHKDEPSAFSVDNLVLRVRGGSLIYKSIYIETRFMDGLDGPDDPDRVLLFVAHTHKEYRKAGEPGLDQAILGVGMYGYKGSEWVGITQRHVEGLKGLWHDVCESHYFEQGVFEKVKFENALRYNQGDLYMNDHLGDAWVPDITEPKDREIV